MSKKSFFFPRPDCAAEFVYHPSPAIKKRYPDAEVEFLGMDLQEGEHMALLPKAEKQKGTSLVVDIAAGKVELIDFEKNWTRSNAGNDDDVVWDADRLIEAWGSSD